MPVCACPHKIGGSMSKPKVAILDYGMGNLFSVQQACNFAGLEAGITNNEQNILSSSALIVPGVGAFGDAMSALRLKRLDRVIKDFIKSGKLFMGICLGLQILFSESEEFGLHEGLDVFPGKVLKFDLPDKNIKVPQVGWNRIFSQKGSCRWKNSELDGITNGEFMYFVHSFYAPLSLSDYILATSTYEGIEYCAAVKKDNVFACQFHPEKSANAGIAVYRNFRRMVENS